MPPQDLERKLTAILSADVAGYSLLMRDDEEATVRTLTDYRSAMGNLIQEYRGRVVDSPGDNLLAEFASVVDAVNCAVAIQRRLAVRNAELPENRRMEFRIGVNVGDVVTEGERIYGDGVNIAARLESLAEPGGICISGSVYSQVKNRLKLKYDNLGEKSVKNMKEPVSVYLVLMEPENVADVTAETKAIPRISPEVFPEGVKEFELPEGPSIAVLPFVNMSDDPKQEYFSDGLTENIIAGLSAEGRLLVIARNSTFVYKGKSVDVQEVGRKLGVQYLVEGSVQKTEDRVRITAQLIDANTGHHVWSDRYDRELKDIFALQDDITMKIMRAVGVRLVHGEQSAELVMPPSGSLEVLMKTMKAAGYMYRMNKEGNVLARKEVEEAIALDPEYSLLYSMLASTHLGDLLYQSSESPEISFGQASKNIKKALALSDENYYAHQALAQLCSFSKEHDKAIAAAERAIAINPSGADAYARLGLVLIMSGRAEEGVKLIEKAMRLNPIPPDLYLNYLGSGYHLLGRYEDAIEANRRVLKRSPNNLWAQIGLTAAYVASGREEEARHQAEALLRLDPAFSLDRYAQAVSLFFEDKDEAERYIADLRKAGLK
jgi:adenylate cyclase